ncbi:MAG: hypothetical protein H6577_27995 [Lewinellaceae bacterium]|nr:hypothetical protein [Saprospiraceae bacterium]MCB9341988.1 hypothetical protein [Lewinellaceae bacterium]
MKNFILLILLQCAATGLLAQMNYQCTVLDSNDDPVANSTISVRASIRLNSAAGTISYQETHSTATDDFGRINIAIGKGSPTIGTYANVPRTGLHFLQIEVDLNGGTNYQTLATTEIHPSFKADEVDPLFAASPAATITNADISNWNNAGGAGSVVELDNSNYTTADINNNDIVDVQEIIVLSSNFNSMNNNRLLITGGGFQGTGTQVVDLGTFSTVSNVHFQDVILSGSYIQFVNCYFEGAIRMPSNSTVTGGRIFNGDISTIVSLRNISLCDITNTTFPRVENITHCKIQNSTIGSTTYNPQVVANCDIDDCIIFMNGEFTGNNCGDATLKINDGADFVLINGNEFDSNHPSEAFIIVVNRNSTAAKHQVKISDNIFWGDLSSSKHVQVNGTYSNGSYDSFVHLIGNSFTRGSQVIENNSTAVNLVISNNILNSLPSLGVSAGSNVILINNTIIP